MSFLYSLGPAFNFQFWEEFVLSNSPEAYIFASDFVTSTLTFSGNPNYPTGQAVTLSTSGVLPSPLSNNVTYYITLPSGNTTKLASTYSNAISNIPLNLSDNGSGVNTMTTEGQSYLKPLANGKVYTYSSQDHSKNKATYTDSTGLTQNTNPIILDNKGMANIYWEVNTKDDSDDYYVVVQNANGVQIQSIDKYNSNTSSGGLVPVVSDPTINHARNPMFTFWDLYDYDYLSDGQFYAPGSIIDLQVMPTAGFVEFSNEWIFSKSNNNAEDTMGAGTFPAGDPSVDNNPIHYFIYSCNNAGAGAETYKFISQRYDNVQTFSGQNLTFQISLQSTQVSTPITISAVQYFGATGSASVPVTGATWTVSDSWDNYSVVFNVPTIDGKNIMPGSYFEIRINLPINTISSLMGTRVSTQLTNIPSSFYPQITVEEQRLTLTTTGNTSDVSILLDIINIPRSWIYFRNGTIGLPISNATLRANQDTQSLYYLIWATYSDVQCPLYLPNGTPTVRGATASADLLAGNQISLPNNEGRVICNVGTSQYYFQFTATSDILTIDPLAAINIYQGTLVQLITTGTLPGGLAVLTNYYMIPITSTTYRICATLADAMAGGPYITTTTAGTGIQTIKWYENNNINGNFYGENEHSLTAAEGPSHNHNLVPDGSAVIGIGTYNPGGEIHGNFTAGSSFWEVPVGSVQNSGNNIPHNINQPSLVLSYIIKL